MTGRSWRGTPVTRDGAVLIAVGLLSLAFWAALAGALTILT